MELTDRENLLIRHCISVVIYDENYEWKEDERERTRKLRAHLYFHDDIETDDNCRLANVALDEVISRLCHLSPFKEFKLLRINLCELRKRFNLSRVVSELR